MGSSSSSVSEPPNRIRASSIRRRCPPDSVRSGCLSTFCGRPRLEASAAASDSAAYPPRTVSRSSRWPYLRTAASRRARVGVGHRDLGRAHAGHQRVQAARREHPVHRERLQVADPGVLRQVSDGSADPNLARGRPGLPGQHPRERRLARAIPADQADFVARRDLEGSGLKQQPRARAQLYRSRGNHRKTTPITEQKGQQIAHDTPAPGRSVTTRAVACDQFIRAAGGSGNAITRSGRAGEPDPDGPE